MRRTLAFFSLLTLSACDTTSGVQYTADVPESADVPRPIEDTGTFTPDAIVIERNVAMWQLPRMPSSEFSLPWPNDISRTPDGMIDLQVVPNGDGNSIVSAYIRTFDRHLDGFSPIGAVYLRFGMALDPTTLPATPTATLAETSSVQIINVDPMSPERGQRIPAQLLFRAAPTAYWPSNTLAVAPVHGFPMRPRTRYAVVALNTLRGRAGRRLIRDQDLDTLLTMTTGDESVLRARTLYTPALDELARAHIASTDILSMTVFTTSDPSQDFFRAADWLRASGPMPALIDSAPQRAGMNYLMTTGHYGPNPVFQAGTSPYTALGTGGFVLGDDHVPRVQTTEQIRFALTIPDGAMPEQGWPLAIYVHGTGGNAGSFVTDGSAEAAAAQHVAMLGFDQIFHGERLPMGTTPETAFFNFTNPTAGRTNNQQAALDLVQIGRFVRTARIPVRLDDGTIVQARFDPAHIMLFGHSQGGLNGPLWLAADDTARTAVLSGAGGSLALSLMLKTLPINIPSVLSGAIGADAEELSPLHPVLTLAQTIADPSDPVNYGRYLVREPRAGNHPHNIFQTQGFVDHYAPGPTIAALALSIGLPLVNPITHPEAAYPLSGVAPVNLPVHNNLSTATATGAWMQFDAPAGTDGHFVVFRVPGARLRAAAFLGSAARSADANPTLPEAVE